MLISFPLKAALAPNAVEGFVKDFKDTLVYARLLSADGVLSTENAEEENGAEDNSDLPQERENDPKVVNSGKISLRITPKPGMNQDVFTLEEGDVTIQWPKVLSKDSYVDLEDWLELIKRKAKRAIQAEEKKAE